MLTEVFHSSYNFEFEPATSTHAHGDDLKMLLNGCLESIFIEISFDKKRKVIVGLI